MKNNPFTFDFFNEYVYGCTLYLAFIPIVIYEASDLTGWSRAAAFLGCAVFFMLLFLSLMACARYLAANSSLISRLLIKGTRAPERDSKDINLIVWVPPFPGLLFFSFLLKRMSWLWALIGGAALCLLFIYGLARFVDKANADSQ